MSDPDTSCDKNSAASDGVSAPTCPVSHSTSAKQLCTVNGFAIWRCPESASDFVWPMPSDQALKEMYDSESYFEGGDHGGYSNYDVQTEPSLQLVTEILDRFPIDGQTHSVLDIGCSYGSHLRLAADRSWKCHGIELSEHARNIAKQRHGDRMAIVERAEDLTPQCFDLVLMLEVIEHLKDPYPLFRTLFAKGVIGPDTLLIVTTPNARSNDAVANPGTWEYRHPPSHLVYYSGKTLQLFLERLRFKDIFVRGIVDLPPSSPSRFVDESPSINDDLGNAMGICAEGIGSDLSKFMTQCDTQDAFFDNAIPPPLENEKPIAHNQAVDEYEDRLVRQSKVHTIALKGRDFVLKGREHVIREREKELAETRAWVKTQEEEKAWINQQLQQHGIILEQQNGELQRRHEELQRQAVALQESARLIQLLQQELAETRAWVTTLNEGKEWLSGQNQNLENQLAERLRVLNETETRLNRITKSRVWKGLKALRIVPKV